MMGFFDAQSPEIRIFNRVAGQRKFKYGLPFFATATDLTFLWAVPNQIKT